MDGLGIKSSKKCTNNSALGFTPECTNAGNTQPNAPRLAPDTGVEERSRDPGGVRQVTAGNGGMELAMCSGTGCWRLRGFPRLALGV